MSTGLLLDWSLGGLIGAIQSTILNYGKIIIMIVGLVMLIVGIYQVGKNLITHGKGQTNWIVTGALIVIGGALMLTTSWDMVLNVAKGGNTTIGNLGQGNADTVKGNTTIN